MRWNLKFFSVAANAALLVIFGFHSAATANAQQRIPPCNIPLPAGTPCFVPPPAPTETAPISAPISTSSAGTPQPGTYFPPVQVDPTQIAESLESKARTAPPAEYERLTPDGMARMSTEEMYEALYVAARFDDADGINELLARGISANGNVEKYDVENNSQYSPLMLAASEGGEEGNIAAIKALLDGGADINLVIPIGESDKFTALGAAIKNNNVKSVLYLLARKAKTDLDVRAGEPLNISEEVKEFQKGKEKKQIEQLLDSEGEKEVEKKAEKKVEKEGEQ